ncbi:MAG: choice-of-anchor B family protein, partial [Bacteroidota bacterium]
MKFRLFLGFLALSTALSAQLNTTLRSNLLYDDSVNDVWGYVAPDGTEYAIIGLLNGVSFVSLADPDNAVEVVRINGVRSAWRDMKTYRNYAYSVADQQDEGITAFDLSFLPDSVPFKRTTYEIEGYPAPFVRAHNLYIDTTTARLFTAGGDRRTSVGFGRIIVFDLAEDPMEPKLIALAPDTYAHDVYVQGDTMYASEIYQGELAIYDISDLDNITELGTTRTPFTFTHNAWSTADGLTVFTTDEEPNAPVAAYDISDPNDIELIDEYRPLSSLNTGTIPHNVHVIDDYLSISYYTDGLRVVDASEPDNLVEVANYDTWDGPNGDFNGNWGAYPYLPSGLTLLSDRSTGLYVVDVDYKRAAHLRGVITDVDFGFPINNVDVTVEALEPADTGTDALCRYRTGVATGGSYQVTFTADNYLPLKVNVDFTNGETVVLDTTLTPNIRRFLNQEITVID